MRKFKNKKLATLIIAFLMVFVMAGAFAAFQRLLLLNARVNLFAPMVEIVWMEVELYEGPDLFSPTNPQGIGIGGQTGGGLDRFFGRAANWPAPPAPAILQSYFESHITGAAAGANAHAWWLLAHTGTGQHTTTGQFPDEAHIEDQTLGEPMEYIELMLGMVFDNVDQEYTFRVRMGNPSTVYLYTTDVNVVGEWRDTDAAWIFDPDTGRVYDFDESDPAMIMSLVAPYGATAFYAPQNTIVDVDYSGLLNHQIAPGSYAWGYVTFSAPAANWQAFFDYDEDQTEHFLDNHFLVNIPAYFALEVVATLAP